MKFILALIFCFSSVLCFGQDDIDQKQLSTQLDTAIAQLNSFRIDESLASYAICRTQAKKLGNDSILSIALSNTASIYHIYGQVDSVVILGREILKLNKVPPTILSDTYANLGGIKRVNLELDSALWFFKRSLEQRFLDPDSTGISGLMLELCTSYHHVSAPDSAIQIAYRSLDWLPKTTGTDMIGGIYLKLAELFQDLNNLEKSREYGLKALEEAKRNGHHIRTLESLILLKETAYLNNNYSEMDSLLTVAESINDGRFIVQDINITMGRLKYKVDVGEAITSAELDHLKVLRDKTEREYLINRIDLFILSQTYQNFSKEEFNDRIAELWNNLQADDKLYYANKILLIKHRAEVDRGDWKNAHLTLQRINGVKSKLSMKDQEYSVLNLEAQYERKEQDQRIAYLDTENGIKSELIESKNRVIWSIGLGLVLISALSFFLFRLYREVNTQKQVIADSLKEKDTLLREIHHRVKNNLQVVSSLLRLQTNSTKDSAAIEALKEGQTRVQSMSLIHQNLYSKDNLTGIGMRNYLEQLCQNLLDTYSTDQHVKLETDIDDIKLDVDTVVPLGLIINELITNSLKYAFPSNTNGSISIILKDNADNLHLLVKDDGIGISDNIDLDSGDSFGFGLIQAFTSKLDAEISIDGKSGTEVEIIIREYRVV